VQWIELTPYQVAERIVHVVMASIFIWIALVGIALQL
jgi:cytochrome b subunit of formate dehydrogenase